jgi:hypothetical protein
MEGGNVNADETKSGKGLARAAQKGAKGTSAYNPQGEDSSGLYQINLGWAPTKGSGKK